METAKKIIGKLEAAGYRAYIVGGVVRDIVCGVAPEDIDIATEAEPEQIIAIAQSQCWKAIPIGIAFGVVAVVAEGRAYEIATLRSERYGVDSHRPETVTLGVSLEQDLARRDFTINAMAMDVSGQIIDLFGGRKDLAAGVIRAVGNPRQRFTEDGLRMFRAARFAARFGFELEEQTLQAIPVALPRVNGLAVERVRSEIEKTLLAEYAVQGLTILQKTGLLSANCQTREQGETYQVPILPELARLVNLPQNPRHHLHDVWQHTLEVVALAPCTPILRWAALLHDVAKGWPEVRCLNKEGQPSDPGHDKIGAQAAVSILSRLKVEPQIVARVAWLIRHHLFFPEVEEKAVMKWLKRLLDKRFKTAGDFAEAISQLLALHEADRLGGHTHPDITGLHEVRLLVQGILRDIPFFPAQLAVSGREIAAKLGCGLQVRDFQENLLNRIQAGQLPNTPAALQAALEARARRLV